MANSRRDILCELSGDKRSDEGSTTVLKERSIAVRFASGLDVLNSYWGYLSDGGLVVDPSIPGAVDEELEVGDPVELSIAIASSKASYQLRGKVVRRRDHGDVVIAFDPGQPHDLLLSEALAETDNVPARRHRRYAIDLEAFVVKCSGADEAQAAASTPRLKSRLVNISREGCCVHLGESDRGQISVGTPIAIDAGDITAQGQVVWQRNLERGVRFDVGEASSLVVLHEYLRTLTRTV